MPKQTQTPSRGTSSYPRSDSEIYGRVVYLVFTVFGAIRRPNDAARTPTFRIRRVALDLLKYLWTGDCVGRPALELRTGAHRDIVQAALQWLRDRGVFVEYRPRGRCWTLQVIDVNWRDARIGEIIDLRLLPEVEWRPVMAALASGGYPFRDRQAQEIKVQKARLSR